MRLAVSVVTCMHAPTRTPASGCSFSNRARMVSSTGMRLAAHSIRRRPLPASAMSAMSWSTSSTSQDL